MVRYPVWNDKPVRQYQAFTKDMQALGVRPIIVIDYRTIKGYDSYTQAVERMLARYPTADYWQIGNEPDQPDSESSWYMDPLEYHKLLVSAANVLQPAGKILIGGGLVSGNPEYLRKVPSHPYDYLGIHPYGQYPVRKNPEWAGEGFGDVMDLIDSYRRVVAKPVMVTEFGIPLKAFKSREDRQLYYEDMLVEMSDGGVSAALPYCYSCEQCSDLAIRNEVHI